MRTDADWAWAAGFYEGEGSILSNKNRSKKDGSLGIPSIRLKIGQVDRQPLDRLVSTLDLGYITGPHTRYGGNVQPFYVWQACRYNQIDDFCYGVWPWLSERRREQFRAAYDSRGEKCPTERTDWGVAMRLIAEI